MERSGEGAGEAAPVNKLFALLLVIALPLRAATEDELRRAQELAWQQRFAEAEEIYREMLRRAPRSRAAALGLAQVLLWEQRYAAAARIYRDILRDAPDDADARAGLATAEYWSGDFRAAQRHYEAVLRLRPGDAAARKALAEIASTMTPRFTSDAVYTTDDQPMQRALATATATIFSDPLTTWTGTAGAYALRARELGFGSVTSPFAGIAGSTVFPSLHLRAGASLRLLRFPDGETGPLGGITLVRESRNASLSFELAKHELLYTASSLDAHPTETTASLRWSRETDSHSSAATVRAIRYFDDNRGRAADAYHLVRVARRGNASLSLGGAAAYRDTSESRFRLIGASASPRAGGGFEYSYGARYDPYWTPRRLVELRAIAAATINLHRATLRLHAGGGRARDRDLLFGPSTGTTPLAPLFDEPVEVRRTFHPWSASADIAVPIAGRVDLTFGAERQTTAFYRATTYHGGVSGRF